MTTCKGCGNGFNKGSLAFLLVKGKLKGARVCQKCAGGGVTIVGIHVAPVVVQGQTKDERAILRKALKPIITNLEAQVTALQRTHRPNVSAEEFLNGKIEGMENVLAVLKNAAKEATRGHVRHRPNARASNAKKGCTTQADMGQEGEEVH
jgi:hypothetical protein